MDKWIGLMLLMICMAVVAIGSMVTYQMFGNSNQTQDSYGGTFGNKTNSTIKVETSIAPISVSIDGYIVLMIVIFVIVGAGVLVSKVVMGGGHSHMR
jgi:hypothetical protein